MFDDSGISELVGLYKTILKSVDDEIINDLVRVISTFYNKLCESGFTRSEAIQILCNMKIKQ